MRRIMMAAVTCAACLFSMAFAADKDCTLQIPQGGCKCEKCVECSRTDGCGNCQDIPYVKDDCHGIPVSQEDPRVIDPNCCIGSSFCLLDASPGQYTMCCPGGCYELLNKCQKDLCPQCKETKCDCEKKSCGCKEKCGESKCGCKQKECGCKQKECGCKAKEKCGCESKCGGCGSVECGCYMPYVAPAPRPQPEPVVTPPTQIYVQVDEGPFLPPVEDKPEVIKVEGRG